MKVAVTGGAGNIGRYVVGWLNAAGYDVIAIDQREPEDSFGPDIEMRLADLTSYPEAFISMRDADRVVHLAGIPGPLMAPEWQVHNLNTSSSYNVLVAAAELGISRVVQSSSINAIGAAWSRTPTFDYLPVDLDHPARPEDGYSLSKLAQEIQAESVVRRYNTMSIVSLRLHAVLNQASDARMYTDGLGMKWAVNGLFGYCTFESVASAIELGLTAPITGAQTLWVVEPETFSEIPTAELARTYYPDVSLRRELVGNEALIDASRTTALLGWIPSTAVESASSFES